MVSAARRAFSSKVCFRWMTGCAERTASGRTASTALKPTLSHKQQQPTKTRRPAMPATPTALDERTATPAKQLAARDALAAWPQRVFDALTDPEQLTQWWWPRGSTCPAAQVDLRVGGTYKLAMQWPDAVPRS